MKFKAHSQSTCLSFLHIWDTTKRIGQDHFAAVWGSLHLLLNKPVTLPALSVLIYTLGLEGVKCLTQGHNLLTIVGLEPTTSCSWLMANS